MQRSKQYNTCAKDYANTFEQHNQLSINAYFKQFDTVVLEDKKLLDLGCGDGSDLVIFGKRGALLFGIDASEKMIQLASQKNPTANVKLAYFDKTTYPEKYFDFVVSKWALQTATEIGPIYQEVIRILKPGGFFIFLVTHPLRHFMEKRTKVKNYFNKEMVTSHLFNNTISVQEPSHTLDEYLSPYFFNNFTLLHFEEGIDEGAQKIDGHIYPAYFIVKAQKIYTVSFSNTVAFTNKK